MTPFMHPFYARPLFCLLIEAVQLTAKPANGNLRRRKVDAMLRTDRQEEESLMPMNVTKDEAVRRLREAGYMQEAEELHNWRDANGNNWGWDGWIRGAHPHVVPTIWP